MGTTQVSAVDTKLEVVAIPVSDVDRAKAFYVDLGWRLDADFKAGDTWRIVQVTPPGSACSIVFGKGVTTATPGSVQGIFLVVPDVEAARVALLKGGAQVSEVFHFAGGLRVTGRQGREPGPDPERQSYRTFASFQDPDGNGFLLQEIRTRLPGRGVSSLDVTTARETPAPALNGQTVVVLGGSAGMGLETARRARDAGADVVLTGRNAEALRRAASEVGALRTSAFDVMDPASLEGFFRDLPRPVDHVMVAAGRAPSYGRLVDMDAAQARRAVDEHLLLAVRVARNAAGKMVPGGSLAFMSGIGARRLGAGLGAASLATAALPALVANLALELAPIRVNLIAAGFVDTRLSAALLGDQLEKRRDHLRATLPIRRVVGPGDIAAFAVHIMSNTALTGATYDIDGGQQLVE